MCHVKFHQNYNREQQTTNKALSMIMDPSERNQQQFAFLRLDETKHRKCQDADLVLSMMIHYQEGCELVFDKTTCSVMHALTGHLAMEHLKFLLAISQFQQALAYAPDNQYLTGWIEICKARQSDLS